MSETTTEAEPGGSADADATPTHAAEQVEANADGTADAGTPAADAPELDDCRTPATRCATRPTGGCRASRSRARWSSSASAATCPARS